MTGSIGPVEFKASESYVKTFQDMTISHKANYAGHKIINGPEIIEFTGTDASSVTLKIHFDSELGVNPADEIEALRDMTHTSSPVPFVLNGNVIGRDLWVIESMNVTVGNVAYDGYILSADVSLTLKEFIQNDR